MLPSFRLKVIDLLVGDTNRDFAFMLLYKPFFLFFISVVKCVGRVRVEFTRKPYTYWCMSFVSPPELELVVESKLEGHSVPQLNRIIGIQVIFFYVPFSPTMISVIRLLLTYFQLRRRINRKFVMPFYKIRSKPFLPTHHMINLNDNSNEMVPVGKLHITVLSLTRVAKFNGSISCTLLLGNFSFSSLGEIHFLYF